MVSPSEQFFDSWLSAFPPRLKDNWLRRRSQPPPDHIHSQPLQTLNCGSHGEFPYDDQHSANLLFNQLTYNWINSIPGGGSARYVQDQIATSSNQVSIEMTSSGCNLVNCGPAPFKMSTGNFWAYFSPIQQATHNGNLDISGFKFAPDPGIDFSSNGPFDFVNGVAIANYPAINIAVTSSDYQSILTTFQQTTSTKVTFLGIPLASGSSETVSITLPSCPGRNPGLIPTAFSAQPAKTA
jgi:hypothetical protein